MKRLWKKPWLCVHADGDVTPLPAPANPPPPPKTADPPVVDPEDAPTISQKKLNAVLAEEKRKFQETQKKQLEQLQELERSKGLSDKEREQLSKQIEDLKTSVMTKEQLAAKEKEKLQSELSAQIKAEKERADKAWQLYTESTIERAITDAAARNEAFRPSQVVTFLVGKTHLVEDKDGSGNSTGTFTPRVKFPDVKDGKPIVLDLTVEEAVKRMKDLPDEYGNLFKSGVAGGLGGTSGVDGGSGAGQGPPEDPEAYRKWRENQRKMGKL